MIASSVDELGSAVLLAEKVAGEIVEEAQLEAAKVLEEAQAEAARLRERTPDTASVTGGEEDAPLDSLLQAVDHLRRRVDEALDLIACSVAAARTRIGQDMAGFREHLARYVELSQSSAGDPGLPPVEPGSPPLETGSELARGGMALRRRAVPGESTAEP